MKPTNPNFGSNFSNDNMAESVKLADYTGSDHEVNVRKQFMKYATGGKQHYDISEQKQKSQQRFDMPGIKPIKTEQSQISGIQNGFRKVKNNNQGDLLKQLRDQFDRIRKIPANQRQPEEKMSSSSEQSQHSVPHSHSSSASIQSSKLNKKVNNNQRQQRLWEVERKQYEFMLNNCQSKIEQLLHNQMQYKKMIHELRSASFLTKTPVQNKFESEYKQLQRQLKEEKQKNYKLSSELEKLKLTFKQQSEKLGKMQTQFNFKTKDENKLSDEKKRLEQARHLDNIKFMNCEIEKKKYQMQNQLLLKQKQQQMIRFQRQLQHQNVVHELNLKSLMKKLEDEIQIKDRRYMLLVSQYEKLKRQYAITKEEAQKPVNNGNNQLIEIFKTLIEEKRNNNPNEQLTKTVKHLLERLEQKPERVEEKPYRYQFDQVRRPDDHKRHESDHEDHEQHHENDQESQNQYAQKLLSQIRILKAEIEAFKNSGEGIDLEPMKRMYEAEIAALKDTIAILQRKLKNTSPAVIKEEQTPVSFKKERQISELQRKIRELEESAKVSRPENSFSFEDHEQFVSNLKQKLQDVEAQLRAERRKKSQVQFELSKLSKQLQFRVNALRNENKSQLQIKQAQLDQANQNIAYWRKQFQNMRSFYQQKLVEKNRQLEQYANSTELQQIKKKSEQSLNQVKLDYEKQVKAITQRLSNFKTQSLQYDALLKKYTALESAYFDLRKSLFRSKEINDGVDHLWQIKQTEYGNINQVLSQVTHGKRTSQFIPSPIISNISQSNLQTNSVNVVRPPSLSAAQEQTLYSGFNNLIGSGNQPQLQSQQSQTQQQATIVRSSSLNFSNSTNPQLLGNMNQASYTTQGNFANNLPTRNSYEIVDPNARSSAYNNEAVLSRNSSFGVIGQPANRTSVVQSIAPINYRGSSSYEPSQSYVNTYQSPVYV